MNWKTVALLISVERKSGRLLRGQRLTRYRENRFLAHWVYWVAFAIGLLVGGLVGRFYMAVSADPNIAMQFQQGAVSLFLSLPTLVLIYSLVFTMLGQIQRSGVKATSQVPYWLPITWQEHTLASVLANMLGFPIASVLAIASAIILFSVFAGLAVPAVMTSLAMSAAAFMASATTETFRILQVRFIGAVYKSTGRAAVWVRFMGSLAFFVVFYILYFSVVGSGSLTFIQSIASAQNAVWFVPFVWLGMTLYSFTAGLMLQGLIFLGLSLLFIACMFFLATQLNRRFGLYEPPAITITRGTYVPRTGLLGRLGFSTVEAAIIRKDFKAFTRRRELMTIFIGPIVIVLIPLMQSLSQTNQPVPSQVSLLWTTLIFLFPASIMAMSVGNLIIGEEGQAVWRIYAAPVSPRNLVKSKYFIIVFFSLIVLAVTGTVGFLVSQPTLRTATIVILEAAFLAFALGAISFTIGLKGADFNEVPRPRMIRVEWSFISLIACFLSALAILGPLVPNAFSGLIPEITALDPYLAVAISGVVAAVLAAVFYQIAVKNAEQLLKKAEI